MRGPDFDQVSEVTGDGLDGGLAADPAVSERHQGVPPGGTADGKADVAWNRGGSFQPALDMGLGVASTEHDNAGGAATAAADLSHQRAAVLGLLQALHLPDVWLDAVALELADGAEHELGAELRVVACPLAPHAPDLGLGHGNQQLEHEAVGPRRQPGRQLGQSSRLPAVELDVAVGVVAHQDLAEVGVELDDVAGGSIPLLEPALRPARPLHPASPGDARITG